MGRGARAGPWLNTALRALVELTWRGFAHLPRGHGVRPEVRLHVCSRKRPSLSFSGVVEYPLEKAAGSPSAFDQRVLEQELDGGGHRI